MRFIFAVLMGVALTGCAVTGALYESESRTVLPLSFVGSQTFCWEGLDMTVVDIRPVGWGEHECERPEASLPSLPD